MLAFWALVPSDPSTSAHVPLEADSERAGRSHGMRLAVAILDADEEDGRVKGIREKLYPGACLPPYRRATQKATWTPDCAWLSERAIVAMRASDGSDPQALYCT